MSDDNKKQVQNSSDPVVPNTDLPPVLSMEDNVPPTLQQTEPSLVTPPSDLPKPEENIKVDETSGSAAPSEDIVMPPVITTQKKKFAGGKVIATILGLFLLVGGVGAGTYLVQQNQNIEEKALNACVCKNANGVNAGNGTCRGSGTTAYCDCAPLEVKTDNCNVVNGATGVAPGTTPQQLNERCLFLSGKSQQGIEAGCSQAGKTCTAEFASDCANWTPPNTATTTPITASCQNVKAYTPEWVLLAAADLSKLKVGDNVNFCVTGAKTGGSFNKARFTINTVLQPETTTVRPSSQDFCQLYTIPAGTTTFNVTAQINHSTLGWK